MLRASLSAVWIIGLVGCLSDPIPSGLATAAAADTSGDMDAAVPTEDSGTAPDDTLTQLPETTPQPDVSTPPSVCRPPEGTVCGLVPTDGVHVEDSLAVDLNSDGCDEFLLVDSGLRELHVVWGGVDTCVTSAPTEWTSGQRLRPVRVIAADFDGDAALDLMVLGDRQGSNNDRVAHLVGWTNDGQGRFDAAPLEMEVPPIQGAAFDLSNGPPQLLAARLFGGATPDLVLSNGQLVLAMDVDWSTSFAQAASGLTLLVGPSGSNSIFDAVFSLRAIPDADGIRDSVLVLSWTGVGRLFRNVGGDLVNQVEDFEIGNEQPFSEAVLDLGAHDLDLIVTRNGPPRVIGLELDSPARMADYDGLDVPTGDRFWDHVATGPLTGLGPDIVLVDGDNDTEFPRGPSRVAILLPGLYVGGDSVHITGSMASWTFTGGFNPWRVAIIRRYGVEAEWPGIVVVSRSGDIRCLRTTAARMLEACP